MVTRIAAFLIFFIVILILPLIFIYYFFKLDFKGFLSEIKYTFLIGLIVISGNDNLYRKYSKEQDIKIKEKIDKLSK